MLRLTARGCAEAVGCYRCAVRLLFIGDVFGTPGMAAAVTFLKRERPNFDFIIVNGENAAGGFGLTRRHFEQLRDAGADVVTLGNHGFDQSDALEVVEETTRLLRPANYPPGTPGVGSAVYETEKGERIAVMQVMGRVFMEALDDPFAAVDAASEGLPAGVPLVIDFHAEATSEKMGMGHWCDGMASLVVGTHTHVPTSDTMILGKGTGYQSDAGMCGDYDSVIGMEKLEPLRRFLTGMAKGRFEPANGAATLSGVYVETDDKTGLATRVRMIRVGGKLQESVP